MGYNVWSIFDARAQAKPHKSLKSLKQSLRQEWDRIALEKLRFITENVTKRLKLCIHTNGDHFETI